ncbi:MAG: S9 family peptidase [Bacillota bacterium]|nr:S9 family peptidase [Bacillota bacterium]
MTGINLKTLLEYKYISNLKYIKEKNTLAFVVSQGNEEENNYDSNIFTYNLDTKTLKQMTADNKVPSFYLIDDQLVFKAQRTKEEKDLADKGFKASNMYKLSLDGGEAQKIFSLPLEAGKFKKLDDNTYIFTATTNKKKPNLFDIQDAEDKAKKIEEGAKFLEEEKAYERLSQIPFWFNGAGFVDGDLTGLYIYKLDEDRTIRISPDDMNVSSFELVGDRAYVIYSDYSPKMVLFDKLGYFDLKNYSFTELFVDENISLSYVNELGGQIFLVGGDLSVQGINGSVNFYILKDGQLKNINPQGLDISVFNDINTDARLYGTENKAVYKDRFYFTSVQGVDAKLYSIDVNGDYRLEMDIPGSTDGFVFGDQGEIYSVAFRENRLQELYAFVDGKEEKLTSFNDKILEDYEISQPEYVEVDHNGLILQSYIMKPIGFEPGKKYKTILEIHGGPKTAFGSIFFSEMQYLANLGYVVIYTNPRGSDGRGFDFSDIRGKYGSIDYEDLMYFTREMVKKYDFIDEDRLGVTGGSYGGYMTNWIVGHTDLFKAAVTQRSISNWVSKFATTDIGYFFVKDQVGFTPWEDIEKIWDNSPLKYADQVKTPTLIIHSEEDFRCDVDQGYQFYTALKYFGVDAEMLMLRGENHNLSRTGRPKQRIERLKAIADWFQRKIK